MALLASKRRVFKPTPYGYRPRRRRIPRWLVLMLAGMALGAGGLLFLQKSYGPIRLTAEQSEQLHMDLNSANLDKQRLQSQLNQQSYELDDARARLEQQGAQLREAQSALAQVQADLDVLADAIPPDPRGTSPGIRAARFQANPGRLTYRILLMQDADKAQPFTGTMDFAVAGRLGNGRNVTIDLPAIDVALTRYAQFDGVLSLPETMTAREITIRVRRAGETQIRATRTLRVAS